MRGAKKKNTCLGRWAVGSGRPELSSPNPVARAKKLLAKNNLFGEVGGGAWKARVMLSVPFRDPPPTQTTVGVGGGGPGDPNDCLGPDERGGG